ncbi:MAG: tetraacyldisaccharide 4'-kinase [Acidobacteria bacterium]|nr:tetraacyldisaccharide 4'-kinase [Acidobacteriota bacterium]
MFAALAGQIYGSAALVRRRYYSRHPEARVRLRCPVISVGSLAVGGSGKTPAAATLARLLIELGERPAILSRGYARRDARDGVTVVSDGRRLRADLDRAGDEPLMLARSTPGAAVLVCPDRHLAGLYAERRLGATVHLLDDGFQHLRLERNIDLLIVDAADVRSGRPMPAGRLREPLSAARWADAVIAIGDQTETQAIADRLQPARMFRGERVTEPMRLENLPPAPRLRSGHPERESTGEGGSHENRAAGNEDPPREGGSHEGRIVGHEDRAVGARRALAVAAIARPATFFEAVRRAGIDLAGTLVFRDHQAFTARDIERIERDARRLGAEVVLTTEKDWIRLRPFRPLPFPLSVLPLRFVIEPADAFRLWIRNALATRCT